MELEALNALSRGGGIVGEVMASKQQLWRAKLSRWGVEGSSTTGQGGGRWHRWRGDAGARTQVHRGPGRKPSGLVRGCWCGGDMLEQVRW